MKLEGLEILVAILGITGMLGVLIWVYDEKLFKKIRNVTLIFLGLALIRVFATVVGIVEPLSDEAAALEHFANKARLTEIGESEGTTTEDLEQSRVISKIESIRNQQGASEQQSISSMITEDLLNELDAIDSIENITENNVDEEQDVNGFIDLCSVVTTNIIEGLTKQLEVTAFDVNIEDVDFRAQWQAGLLGPQDELGVFASTNLCFEGTNTNRLVAKTRIPEPCQAIEFTLPKVALPEEWDLSGVVFKLMELLDSDGDGISDYIEVNCYHTNPNNPDMDGDGINDGDEILLGTSPNDEDSDDDGLDDGQELQFGSNPNSVYSKGDIIDDYTAYILGLDPIGNDSDGDGVDDYTEMIGRSWFVTNPLKADSDGDGIIDGMEMYLYRTNPNSKDSDGDGLSDYQEIRELHTYPTQVDTDGDHISDYFEWIIGTSPTNVTAKTSLCTSISGYNFDNSYGPLYEFSQDFDVNVTYTCEDFDSDYAVFGLHAPDGGTTTSNTLDFEHTGPDTSYHNAFVMTFTNGLFKALRTGWYRFRINVDDWANIDIDGTTITDDYYTVGTGIPGAYAEKLMVAGCEYPVSGVVTNVGGPAKLEFSRYVTFSPTDRVQCRASFSKPFVMCAPNSSEPMSPEQHVFLRVSAKGGDFGGRMRFRSEGLSKLNGFPVEGLDSDILPPYLDVAANSSVNLLVSYQGSSPSISLNDVKLITEFEEFQTGYTSVSTAAVTVVKAAMYADYDRDGDIDDDDKNAWAHGKKLRHWVNTNDANNDVVDGIADMLDFAPVRLDIKELLDLLGDNANSDYRFKIEGPGNAVNCVWTSLAPSEANSFQYTSYTNAGPNLNTDVSSAQVATTNLEMSVSFINHLKNSNSGGVFLVEGKAPSYDPLIFACYRRSDNAVVARVRMPMQISNVEDMYWFHNLRQVCGDNSRYAHQNAMPDNFEEDENNTCLYFLHGFRVSLDGSRDWFAEIFKRFWQTGAKVCFHGVTWASDQGIGDYHRNVANAFATAPALANMINHIPGDKVIMAHSLGNMVVSSAIQDHGLQVRKYLMCNSAVPSEAYSDEDDISIRTPVLVHSDWEQYPTNSWTSSWHKLFVDDLSDGRRLLGWPGRFKDVLPCAVNFYSSGDEVLELESNNRVWLTDSVIDDLARYAWHKQEILKGRTAVGGTVWTGWGVRRILLPYGFSINLISQNQASTMSDEDFKTNTVFNAYPKSFLSRNITRSVADKHLSYGVPALAPAMGKSALPIVQANWVRNYNLGETADAQNLYKGVLRPNGWPQRSEIYYGRWLHSDIIEVPYYYNFMAYRIMNQLIITGGAL